MFSNPPGNVNKIFEDNEKTFILPHPSNSGTVEILRISADVYKIRWLDY